MPNSLVQVEAFAASHPSPHQGGTWNQLCEQFINNAGGFSQAFTSALLAGNASGPLDSDPSTAEDGEIHYWSGSGDGHDAFQTSKGLLCASNAIPGYLGYISFAAFKKAKPGFVYRGHTFRHGTQTLDLTSTAGTGTVIPVSPPKGKEDMPELYWATTPAVVPADLLAANSGLLPNTTTYFLLGGSGGTVFNAKVTQTPALANQWSTAVGYGSIPLAWAQALQWWHDALTPLSSGLSDAQVTALGGQLASGIKITVPPFPTVPTAAQNGAAARAAIVAQ